MSTFSGLNTAMSGLNAARLAMETAGNNLANVGTPGYTRQRAEFASVGPVSSTGLLASRPGVGQGVVLTGIARLADAHLDARVRGTLALAAQSDTRAEALSNLEGVLREPGENGLSALLNNFWAGWEDVANQPGENAPAAVLLKSAKAVVNRIAQSRTEISDQWATQRQSLDTMVTDVNAAAGAVAGLNAQIRSSIAAGGAPNALLDQRAQLTQSIAELSGATIRELPDGTVDVLIDGNALVTGSTARPLQVTGSPTMDGSEAPAVQWAHRPGAVALQGGRLAGAVSLLAPAADDDTGTGGSLAEAAKSLDKIALELAGSVNEVHRNGKTVTGETGMDFFEINENDPALSLRVLATGAMDLATRSVNSTPDGMDGGELDGSNATKMSQLGTSADGPDALWSSMVIQIGTATKTEAQQSVSTAVAAASAASAQLSVSAVSLDEENVALIANQHAFQGAARVMTAIDEMLDTLINRTGLVGR
ncbi:flagellar hook-associated protein FlgK [Paeniglutamicibacter psychrophenolicus]|uniref:flagellar hook-associated protein FlgK n=1 Tax=Paeniglutamicibacter psychrophenolicus TaxID=257454 RepID=UPI0027831912|nr:flagellar hook-associated protein FlgK [Paeniglutamicibacter psychrophenolicus]MDQ0094654.1 flagellar hook-associated protein 1 FlgK [Paeniglutamicibacter psychrophenolicus]